MVDHIISDARKFHASARETVSKHIGREVYAYCRRIADSDGKTIVAAPDGVTFVEDEDGISYTLTRGQSVVFCHLAKLSRCDSKVVATDQFDAFLRVYE
jgi:hypothetical protein